MSTQSKIEGFSEAQKTYFNRESTAVKIYSEEIISLSEADKEEVDETIVEVQALNNTALTVLSSNMSAGKKLSKRPC